MIFELGKEYIVSVTEKGIIPLMVFNKDRWFDKDHDDLDFLTDEEKIIIINEVLEKIKAEFVSRYPKNYADEPEMAGTSLAFSLNQVLQIINKYKTESEG